MAIMGSTNSPERDPGGNPRRLGELLVEAQLITDDQLSQARKKRDETGEFLAKILVQSNYVSQEDLNACFVKRCKIPHISLLDYDIGSDVLGLVPKEVCLKQGLLPIDKLGRILTVAMVDPLDEDSLAIVREACPDLRIKPILCNWSHFEQVASKYFAAKVSGAKSEPGEMSAASLGLSAIPPRPAAKPASKPAVQQTPTLDAGMAGGSPLDTAVVVAAIQEGFAGIAEQLRPSVEPSTTLDAEALASSMRGVLSEMMAHSNGEGRATSTPVSNHAGSDASLDTNAAMQLEGLAETLRDTIGGMLQETFATLVVQLRSQPTMESSGSMDRIVEAVRESQSLLVTSVHDLIAAGQQSQELQGARLAAIAEAAVESSQQTTHLIEAALVKRDRTRALSSPGVSHASVSAFGISDPEEDARLHAEADAEVRGALASEVPLDTLTFDSFFPGEANAFTAKMCEGMASSPGSQYNPFFLYGGVGLGKTHLISAVGNRIKQDNPAMRVGYVSASHFSRRLEEAAAHDAQEAFRDNYCHWDVLILDDIQFMGGRVEAQEEFFHIFNVLHQQGRQIIIASDSAPDRLGLLERRLVSRFSSGIVAELKPPEWATRMQILRHHASASGVTLPDEVCSLVAMRVSNDVRKMVGALRKIAAFAAMSSEPVSVERATEILSHIGSEEAA